MIAQTTSPDSAGERPRAIRMNLALLLVRSARAYPQLPAVALGGRVMHDYAALPTAWRAWPRACAKASALQQQRVALVMKNCLQYVELLFACWHAGLCAVPINAKLHPRELEFIFQDTAAGACFVTPDLSEAVAAAQAEATALRHVIDVSGDAYAVLLRHAPMAMAVTGPDESGLAFLHQRHDRQAQGRDAHSRQPAGGGPRVLLRCRHRRAGRRDPACGADVARFRPVHPAACGAGGLQRGAGIGRLRRGGDLRLAARASRRDAVCRADHGEAARCLRRAGAAGQREPEDHRLWRRTDVRCGLQGGHACASAASWRRSTARAKAR